MLLLKEKQEQSVLGMVGGGSGPGGGWPGGDTGRPDWCDILGCLFTDGVISPELAKRLKGDGLDLDRLCALVSPRAAAVTAAAHSDPCRRTEGGDIFSLPRFSP